jgi:hypothetical protein
VRPDDGCVREPREVRVRGAAVASPLASRGFPPIAPGHPGLQTRAGQCVASAHDLDPLCDLARIVTRASSVPRCALSSGVAAKKLGAKNPLRTARSRARRPRCWRYVHARER